MIKGLVLKKIFNLIVAFFMLFLISSSFYFYTSITESRNSIFDALEQVSNLIQDRGFIDLITQDVNALYSLSISQILFFLIASFCLLMLIWHLFNVYLIQRKNALVDSLTGLYNRRALMHSLEYEIERANRFKHSLSIAILDIDFFKKYNDTFGHVEGDRLLKSFSDLLRKKIRETDIYGRIGGEEFVIIFPETSIDDAVKICDRLRMGIEKKNFYGEEKLPNRKLTISCGVSGIEETGVAISPEKLLEKADGYLYNAKLAGRNMVRSFNSYNQ